VNRITFDHRYPARRCGNPPFWPGSADDHTQYITSAERQKVEIRIFTLSDIEYTSFASLCGYSDPAGCMKNDGVYTNSSGSLVHDDYSWSVIFIREQFVPAGSAHHLPINHEIGHTLGLSDKGSECNPPPAPPPACSEDSIMHAIPAGSVTWPTADDRAKVITHTTLATVVGNGILTGTGDTPD
jgi:hypothetical protein